MPAICGAWNGLFAGQARSHRFCIAADLVGAGLPRQEASSNYTNHWPASLRINLPFLSSGMVEPGSRSIFTLPT